MIIQGDCLDVIGRLPNECVSLVYADSPFGTGQTQTARAGRYSDSGIDLVPWLTTRVRSATRVMSPAASLFLHLDWRQVHHVRVALEACGDLCFVQEIIWAYDFGGRSKRCYPRKHDTLLWYVRDPENYTFNVDEMERLPYMAPGLCGPEKAAKGKLPTDVWWQTICPTNGPERTGYPTQKPLGLLERIIKVHSNPGDVVLDPFAGSGTTAESAAKNGRRWICIDQNPQAIAVMEKRLAPYARLSWCPPSPPENDANKTP